MRTASSLALQGAARRRWLSIVGIGEGGIDTLAPVARGLIADAEIVFGGRRHLEFAKTLVRGDARPWPSPLEAGVRCVIAERGRQVCVLASGDPLFYGIGSVLARHVGPDETLIVPGQSSFSLAAARLGWSQSETVMLSLHGRQLDLIRPHLHPRARIFALTSDGEGPEQIAALLTDLGFGSSTIIVLEALGGARERIRTARAADFSIKGIDPLNLVAIEVEATEGARIIARAAGLPDALFEHDGQITKREIRAATLSSLAPTRGEMLWDIGAGSGSVAIEWMLADGSLKAVAIEAAAERAARIRRNAASFGVPGLEIIEGFAPQALVGLPMPDAIFVGGGASQAGTLDAAIAALRPGGRLVVNAVTLETETLLIGQHAARGGALTRIDLARADRIGTKTVWRAAMPLTQWVWRKP